VTTFRYLARQTDGSRIRGEIEASDDKQAVEQLISRRLSPLSVVRSKADRERALSYKDAARLCSEIARLTQAGVPLESGAELAAEAQDSVAARRVLVKAAARLAKGDGPGKAFSGLTGAPGQALSAVIDAGERSGRLADALHAAAPLLGATARFREKIVSLMLYPMAVSITAIGVLGVFLLVVIPSLRPVLEDLGDKMPTSARWMLAVSDAAPGALTVMLVIILASILLGQIAGVRQRMARTRDRLALSPLALGLPEAIDIALFARLFGALLTAGTPAGDAIEQAGAAISNTILRARLAASAGAVREGMPLDQALAIALGERHLIVQASRLGARSGSFAQMVSEAGTTLAERAEMRLERLAALAAPLIIISLGFLIGLLVITLFSSLTALPDAATL
jgi:type II secretory pathway component PulF